MISMCLPPRGHRGAGFRLGLGWNMHNVLMVIVGVSMSWMHNAQSTTVDPESIVPLPDKFDMEMPEPDVSPDIARKAHGSGPGTTTGISSWSSASNPMGMRTWFSYNRTPRYTA